MYYNGGEGVKFPDKKRFECVLYNFKGIGKAKSHF